MLILFGPGANPFDGAVAGNVTDWLPRLLRDWSIIGLSSIHLNFDLFLACYSFNIPKHNWSSMMNELQVTDRFFIRMLVVNIKLPR